MDKLILTDTGGFPLKLDDLLWENGQLDASNYGIYEALQAQLLAYGTDYIVEGCTYAAPNITAGWIMLAGELIRVSAHAGTDNYFAKVITFDARGDKTFKDTSVNSTYQVNRGVLNAASGSLNITTALRLEDKVVQLLATSTQQFAAANIPNLDAAKITTGTLDPAVLPAATYTFQGAAKVATQADVDTGTVDDEMIAPDTLRATTFIAAQIPALDAGKITTGIFAAARIPQATESAIGAAEIATTAEINTGTDNTKMVTPAKLAAVSATLLTKIINIGDWDMSNATGSGAISVAHGLSDHTKIRKWSVIIINDGGTEIYPLDASDNSFGASWGGIDQIDATNVGLSRILGSGFDNVGFDATSYNRGWITLEYLP